MRLNRSQVPKARIEIIPMIDTIFFLLVFFMMASLSMTVSRGLRCPFRIHARSLLHTDAHRKQA